MGKAFAQFFSFFTTLFGAAEKGAKALDQLASWAEQSATMFAEESALDRLAKRKALEEAHGITLNGEPLKLAKK